MQSDVFHRDQGAEISGEWGISKKSVKIKRRIRTALEKRGAGKIDGFGLGIFVVEHRGSASIWSRSGNCFLGLRLCGILARLSMANEILIQFVQQSWVQLERY